MKIKDFAIQEGVTPQAIYKLLKKHEEALKGHVLKGKKFTELDAYAMEYLQEVMIGSTVVVADRQQQDEIQRLKTELKVAQDELIIKNQLLINAQNQVLQLEASRTEEIKAAEDKLKLEMESQRRESENKLKEHYQEEIQRLSTELKTEKERKWKFPWSKY